MLSVLHYLQAGVDPPLLPDLHAGASGEMCEGVDVGFRRMEQWGDGDGDGASSTGTAATLGTADRADLGVLLLGYFQYMLRHASGPYTLTVRSRDGSYFIPKSAWQLTAEREQRLIEVT